jgi:hypothetical protein
MDEETTGKSSLDRLLTQVGLSSDFAQKVRFRGPVGKLALVAVLCVLCLAAIAVKTSSPIVQGMCAVLAVVVALAVASGILWYSHKHPEQATLEGMEVVIMQQQKMWAAAKGIPLIESTEPVVPNPQLAEGDA